MRPSAGGFNESAFSNGDPVFPLEPLIEGLSYSEVDPRFGGTWLGSNASANHNGSAVLFFKDLPPHDGIDLDFVLASTDSSGDADDIIPNAETNGNFQILIDGKVIHETRYTGGSGGDGIVEELISQANLSPNYREEWSDGDGEGPLDAENRTSVGWTLDSAYDYTAYFNADGENPIAHTADTLTVSFIHGLNSASDDEGIAIDSLKLQLLNVTEKVDFAISDISISDTNAVTLKWNSAGGKTYGVDRSFNLESANDWDELADGVESGGAETSFTDSAIPAGTPRAFYRVRLEP